MTPSEEVRKLLDERGVEHRDADETIDDGDGSNPYGQKHVTRWFHHGMECTFAHSSYDDGREETVFDGGLATDFTPAQAIAATVGEEHETCTMQPDGHYGEQHNLYKCSNCGKLRYFGRFGTRELGWTYCPNCRARIKEEAE